MKFVLYKVASKADIKPFLKMVQFERHNKQKEISYALNSIRSTARQYTCHGVFDVHNHLAYRTIATTPAAKARPPKPTPTAAAPPVEAAGLAELEALLEAEEAELLADLVAVLMALEAAPEAELWWPEAAD